jgi:hypothetical protein
VTRDELLTELRRCEVFSEDDEEVAHWDADKALLKFINDPEITEAFEAIRRWYA